MTDQTTTPTVSEAQMTTETKHMPSEREIEAAWRASGALLLNSFAEGYHAASQFRAPDQSERVRGLEAELAEADRRAGKAERSLARMENDERTTRNCLWEWKQSEGYDDDTPFDDVWAAVRKQRDEAKAALAEARKVIDALIGTCGAPQIAIAARDWLTRNPESSK